MLNREEDEGPPSRGKLYIIATPIGNLEDLTFRALRTLREVSWVACEDTRQTRKLLNKYKLTKKLISYYQPKERQKIPQIIQLLNEGQDVALVSDAGTPGLSDPGYPLLSETLKQGLQIIPIPGASALTAALSSSGLPTHRFLFIGFPPPRREATKKLLLSLRGEKGTLIFYLPVRKLQLFLKIVDESLGTRRVVIAREMTKIHEEFLRGTPAGLLKTLEQRRIKGEITLLIEGYTKRIKKKQVIKI